jgi:hypothetical protein
VRVELENLRKELAAYGACDPVKLAEKRKGLEMAKEAALRWTGAL